MNGGDVSEELLKCPSAASGIGCYLNNSPIDRQLAFAFMSSLMPSFSKLKAKVKGKFTTADTWVCFQYTAWVMMHRLFWKGKQRLQNFYPLAAQ